MKQSARASRNGNSIIESFPSEHLAAASNHATGDSSVSMPLTNFKANEKKRKKIAPLLSFLSSPFPLLRLLKFLKSLITTTSLLLTESSIKLLCLLILPDINTRRTTANELLFLEKKKNPIKMLQVENQTPERLTGKNSIARACVI